MINTQAMAAVTAMLSAFGEPQVADNTAKVSCLAAEVFEQARTARFERKLEIAEGHWLRGKCNIVQASFTAGPQVEFRHKRDAEAWEDAVLASLSVMQSAKQPVLPALDAMNARSDIIAHGNILDFWQATPIDGIDIEPSLDMLQHVAASLQP